MMTSYSLYRTRSGTDSAAPSTPGQAVVGAATHYSDSWKADCEWGLTVTTQTGLTGTWTLWATDNPNASDTDDTDWVDTSGHAEFVEDNPAGAATKWRVNSVLIRAGKLRLKYVHTAGPGRIFAYVSRCE